MVSDCNVKRVEYANIYHATAVLLDALNTYVFFSLYWFYFLPFFLFLYTENFHGQHQTAEDKVVTRLLIPPHQLNGSTVQNFGATPHFFIFCWENWKHIWKYSTWLHKTCCHWFTVQFLCNLGSLSLFSLFPFIRKGFLPFLRTHCPPMLRYTIG